MTHTGLFISMVAEEGTRFRCPCCLTHVIMSR